MSGNRMVEFINLHAVCGEIRQAWTEDQASMLCLECGATLTVDFAESSEADMLAQLGDAIRALNLSHDELLILSDPEVSVDAAAAIVAAHPQLKALLNAQSDAAAKRRTTH